jgi:hypothetical protein
MEKNMEEKKPRRRGERVRSSGLIYILKASMKYTKPPVWRRLSVPGDIQLSELMTALLCSMGFENSHLSCFTIDGQIYEAFPDEFPGLDSERPKGMNYRLCDLVSEPKTKFFYEYDYGDSWEYAITTEKIESAPDAKQVVTCLAGRGNYFMDDIGGVPGYAYAVEMLSDPNAEGHAEYVDMYGSLSEFVQTFDIDELNSILRKIKI